jgi:hypothetical protein
VVRPREAFPLIGGCFTGPAFALVLINQFPCFDFVEELEENDSKENLFGICWEVRTVNYMPD